MAASPLPSRVPIAGIVQNSNKMAAYFQFLTLWKFKPLFQTPLKYPFPLTPPTKLFSTAPGRTAEGAARTGENQGVRGRSREDVRRTGEHLGPARARTLIIGQKAEPSPGSLGWEQGREMFDWYSTQQLHAHGPRSLRQEQPRTNLSLQQPPSSNR